MNILEALDHPRLFAPHFAEGSWGPWRAFLAALFGLPASDEDRAIIGACTGRDDLPTGKFSEAWLVCGRRAGKSRTMALLAVYLACFLDWKPYLAAGEEGTVMVIATDRKQARVILRYVSGLLRAVPLLANEVTRETDELIGLERKRIAIEVHSASFRATRGYTVVAALLDELAFWRSDESANPDEEIVEAIRPAMSTIPGALLIGASSPYAKRGVLCRMHKEHHGQAGSDVLVWQAPTRTMNPAVPQAFIDRALARDPAKARAEYMAQFRDDVESFISREQIEALIMPGVKARGRVPGIVYHAFVDPSGGVSDSMTLAIAHMEGPHRVLDALLEVKPPFSPEAVVKDFAGLLRAYGISTVRGDRYGGEWPRERFRKHGIVYETADAAKSDIYRDLLPILTSGAVDLLDNPRLVLQLANLERRKGRAGRDTIDHPAGSHDDLANAAAGALVGADGGGAFVYVGAASGTRARGLMLSGGIN